MVVGTILQFGLVLVALSMWYAHFVHMTPGLALGHVHSFLDAAHRLDVAKSAATFRADASLFPTLSRNLYNTDSTRTADLVNFLAIDGLRVVDRELLCIQTVVPGSTFLVAMHVTWGMPTGPVVARMSFIVDAGGIAHLHSSIAPPAYERATTTPM